MPTIKSATRTAMPGIGLILSLFLMAGCVSDNGNPAAGSLGITKAKSCKAGDQIVSGEQDCMQDDAACYKLENGKWCTGERGPSCPAGSTPLASTDSCPQGMRCFVVSESLSCGIAYK